MIFKDRQRAADKLYQDLKKNLQIKKNSQYCIVSLLRGGLILGTILAKKLKVKHLPLVVTKVPAPYIPELAIGAVCFEFTYLEPPVIHSLGLAKSEIHQQIKIAEHKFVQYCQNFHLSEDLYGPLKKSVVILVDDGVATGASVKAALLFIRSKKPKATLLVAPVAAADTDLRGFDKLYILDRPSSFGSVSQYYKHFPQVEDDEVKKIIKISTL